MQIIWFLGLSIYPVSYILSIIIRLLGGGRGAGESYILEPPASIPFWCLLTFLDSIVNRFFGTNSGQFNTTMQSVFWLLLIVILIAINTICFKVVISILPRNWRFAAIIILYIFLVAINAYIPEINL